jgi:site-specific DNA-methyltransferase (adenine-specific)
MISIYNPDVLNTLANLSSDEVFTSPELANKMLDLLPKNLWSNKNIKFLDPFSKSGVFLREITKRLLIGLEKEIPVLQDRLDYILKNQVFGIAITDLTASISRRTLYCSKKANGKYSISNAFKDISGNIVYEKKEHTWKDEKCIYCSASKTEYLRDNKKEGYAYQFIHTEKPEDVFNMKFDVIIGNPPYQLSDGGAQSSAIPIYHKFVEQAIKLNPRFLVMIVPSRWFTGGKGLDDFRSKMLNDNRISKIIDFPNSSDCFPGVKIEGGVNYFLWDKDHTGNCEITNKLSFDESTVSRKLLEPKFNEFIRYNKSVSIVQKVITKRYGSFSDIVSSRKPYGLDSQFNDFSKVEKNGFIKIYANKSIGFVNPKLVITNKESILKFKVFISYAYGMGGEESLQVINRPILGEPNSCCTETYLEIGPFKSRKESENVIKFLKTKFVRFLILALKSTQHGTSKVYKFVPLLDFSSEWDDLKLYTLFEINNDEKNFIEKIIKSMD